MKYSASAFLLFFALFLKAQTPCGISFDYDGAGNRIKRYQCITGASPLISNPANDQQDAKPFVLKTGADQLQSFVEADWFSGMPPVAAKAAPNPTNGRVIIRVRGFEKEPTVSLLDAMGRLLAVRPLGDGEFDLSGYTAGLYQFVIESGDLRRTVRVVKTEQ